MNITVEIKKTKTVLKKPRIFEVILLNDDYTTMDFVVKVLKNFFNKDELDAEKITLTIHTEGEAVCGVYNYDIAQTKVDRVINFARKNNQPLVCVLREIKS